MIATNTLLLQKTALFDFEHSAVSEFVRSAGCYREPNIARAVEQLHDAVRDDVDYNVFNVPLHKGLSASLVVEERSGFCLHKAVLFVAGCRRLGVPAALCSDVVSNHVADDAMLELVGGTEFLHWYAQIYLNGRWIKAAPIFNALLCTLYGIDVLPFNANGDSIEQRNSPNSKMLYKGQQQIYPDPVMTEVLSVIGRKHPRMVTLDGRTPTSIQLTRALQPVTEG